MLLELSDMSEAKPIGEFGLIDWIRERSRSSGKVSLGIGDDCALLRFRPDSEILVTTDMLMDGRHFRLGEASAEEIGYKALAVNLSDIAAMAGVPVAAFVAVALPRKRAVEVAQGLLIGMNPLLEKFNVSLAGGDTNAWDGPLVVTVTILGETTVRGAIQRSGAQPGDAILVTGPLGGSLLGRHLRPSPRIEEAFAIHQVATIHAMIDISDGLASDLGHILEASGNLGATLEADSIPIHDDALISGGNPLDRALHDGEDFELCLTVSQDEANRLIADPPSGVKLYLIGTIETEPGLRLRQPDGAVIPLAGRGFDHLAPASGIS
jgi:thiamine-monophosphate kinase